MLPLPDTFTAISWNGEIAGSVDFTALPTKSVDRTADVKLCLTLRLWPEYSGLFVNRKSAGQMPSSQNYGSMPKTIPVEINSMETSENQRETQLNRRSTLDVETFSTPVVHGDALASIRSSLWFSYAMVVATIAPAKSEMSLLIAPRVNRS